VTHIAGESMPPFDEVLGNVASVVASEPWHPFDNRAVAFIASLSRVIMNDMSARAFPDVVAFAYWCRTSHLTVLEERYSDLDMMIGRGNSFHVPPANVPLNCAYSFVSGILSGNGCVVRLSSTPSTEVDVFIGAIQTLLESGEHPDVASRIVFVRYGHDDDVTRYLSQHADVRVIWGGDMTVGHIKGIAAKPRCVDVSFADRVSLAILSAETIVSLTDIELEQLCGRFYVDSFTFNQNACSSPKLVVWHGEPTVVEDAKSRFWRCLDSVAISRNQLEPIHMMNRLVELCEVLATERVIEEVHDLESSAVRLKLSRTDEWKKTTGLRFGTFSEVTAHQLSDLSEILDEQVQTVSYFGFKPEEMREWVLNMSQRGVDRIVPVGQALEFDLEWDGYDLIRMMTRSVVVR